MSSWVPGTGNDTAPARRLAAGIVPHVRSLLVLPEHVDTLILGGGTTGAVIAGLLAERSDETVLVLEARPPRRALGGARARPRGRPRLRAARGRPLAETAGRCVDARHRHPRLGLHVG